MTADHPQTHYRTCNLCEAMCGIEITYQDQDVISIKGDAADPFSRGHICPKATALADIYQDPDRLRTPVRRTDNGWESISWDEAFDEVARQIRKTQAEHGQNAVGIYQGNPNVHNLGTTLYSPQFVRAVRTKNRFSATSVDQLPHHYAAYFMYGHQFLLPIPDIDRTDFMLILGANPLASNGSLMTSPDVRNRLRDIQKRNGRFVVVDPRYTETAALANQHLFIRPGTDALLLLALINVIFQEDQVQLGHLAAHIDGGDLAALADLVAPYTPERVADATGIAATDIVALARGFSTAERAVCYGRIGTSTQEFGGVCLWLISVLNIITGNLDTPGGYMFTHPAVDVVAITSGFRSFGSYARWRTRVRGLPEFSGELPVSALAEEILTPGEGQIKMMITIAGNPVLSTPNGRQLDQAFAALDYMVAIDIYINETTRHANIILPPTTGLETGHYDIVFHALAVRNTAKYSEPLMAPHLDARHDWQIFSALRDRLTDKKPAARDLFQRPPEEILDLTLKFGPYGAWGGHGYSREGNGLSLRELRKHPHGIDLGPLKQAFPERLLRRDKRIDLIPEIFVQDLARVNARLLATTDADMTGSRPFILIGRRQLRSNNSWMHNSSRLVKGKNRCTLLMHPDDAARLAIQSGGSAVILSRVGKLTAEVEVTDKMMPGVVSLPHGWGHDREGIQLQTAAAVPGVSVNDLTDDHFIDQLTGNAAFSGVPVTVQPVLN